MGKKRKSGGRAKGQSGKGTTVQCSKCGRHVPRDKAKKKTVRSNVIDWQLQRELEKRDGTFVRGNTHVKYFCVSCAVHRGHVKIRAKEDRRKRR
jgi:small subunit ribosomal protein S26e